MNDESSRVRLAAAENITDEKVLTDITQYIKFNFGNYHNTFAKAHEYWMSRRFGWKNKPQFTLFTFENAKDAEEALLEMDFIHKYNGELICDRMMEYGYYETEQGIYEVILAGFDLTLDEYHKAEESFEKYGGKVKIHQEPEADVTPCIMINGNSENVKFKEETSNNGFKYKVYIADCPEDAGLFLAHIYVDSSTICVCETPIGSFAKDINIFQEIYLSPYTG